MQGGGSWKRLSMIQLQIFPKGDHEFVVAGVRALPASEPCQKPRLPSSWAPSSIRSPAAAAATAPDTISMFAAAAVQTESIRLGTAIVPTYPRHPIVLAQQALVDE